MPLQPPAPAAAVARRALEAAFRDLEHTISPAESRDFVSTTLDDVKRAALDLERQLAARQSLRNMRRLEPLFQGLHHYSKVIEVLCNGTEFLPWVWAPIKLILKISSDYTDAFDRIIKAYSLIAECLGRFQPLAVSFHGHPQLYPVFAVFYADILRFHKAAYKFITRPAWRVLFKTTWGRFEREFDTIISDLKQHEELIDKEVNAQNIVEAREMRETLKTWRHEALQRLALEQSQQTARQMQGVVTWLRLDDSDQIVLFDSLTRVGKRHPGTVDWILKKPQLASWIKADPEPPFLWLQGAPGTGKSVMVARLVSFLHASKDSPVTIHHFCSDTNETSTQYDHIVKSLLLQVARGNGDLVAHIHDEYVGSRQAAIPVLEKLLEMAVDLISGSCGPTNTGIRILLDGLDECPVPQQRRLLRLMKELATKGGNCKVLVSSRNPLPAPKRQKHSLLSLAEEKSCLRDAISGYARLRLSAMRDRLRELGVSDDDVRVISTRIGEKADGMFLWASLVLNYLEANFFYDREEFLTAMEALPRELAAFYEKLLARILANLDIRSVMRLKAIFGWIAFAKRPIRKAELQSALMFQPGESMGKHPVPAHILDACKPLVEERRNSTLAFIHTSVRDYLQSEDCIQSVHLDRDAIRWDHGLASLRCVRSAFDTFSPSLPQNLRQAQVIRGVWGFLPFATESWATALQDMAAATTESGNTELANIASELSGVLLPLAQGPNAAPLLTLSKQQMEELEPVRSQFPNLWYDAALSLHARRSGRHRVDPGCQSHTGGDLIPPTRVHHIFENYEATIRHVVELQHCPPDVTPSEFQLFRANFSGHAYLCRFVSCVHATIGFASNEQRLAHESGHILSFPCSESGCQYPPFGSQQTLRRHLSETHGKGGIRRVGRLSLKPISKPVPRPVANAFTASRTNPSPPPASSSPETPNYLGLKELEEPSYQRIQRATDEEMRRLAEPQEMPRWDDWNRKLELGAQLAMKPLSWFQQQQKLGQMQRQEQIQRREQAEVQALEQYSQARADAQAQAQAQRAQAGMQAWEIKSRRLTAQPPPTDGADQKTDSMLLAEYEERPRLQQERPRLDEEQDEERVIRELQRRKLFPGRQDENLLSFDTFDHLDPGHSPMQRPQDAALFHELHGIGSFSISDTGTHSPGPATRSPSHSPAISPRILPQQLPDMSQQGTFLLQTPNNGYGASPYLQAPQEAFPQLPQEVPDMQGMPAPPSINVDFAPTAIRSGFELPKGLHIDSLTPPERGTLG